MSGFSIELSGRVGAPLPMVWEALTDLESAAQWLDRVDDAEHAVGEGAQQSRWRVGRRWIVGGIVEIEPRRKVVLVLRDTSSLIRQVRVVVRLSPGDRGTWFHVELAGDAAGMAAPLKPWLRLRAEIELHRAVRGFRAWIEERAQRERPAKRRLQHAPVPSIVPRDLTGIDVVGA
jgi:uncharacterized protein YndB with AHSA1/START domain